MHRDGREVTLELTGMPVLSREGVFSGFYGIARDVSRNDPLLTAHSGRVPGCGPLLEQTGDAIFVADAQNGMLIDANQKLSTW